MCDPTRAKAFTQFRSLFCSLVLDPELTLGQVISTDWIAELVAQHVGKTCVKLRPTRYANVRAQWSPSRSWLFRNRE